MAEAAEAKERHNPSGTLTQKEDRVNYAAEEDASAVDVNRWIALDPICWC